MTRILLLGASGTGTTSTARLVSEKLGLFHGDSDYYFWQPTDPSFEKARPIQKIHDLLRADLETHQNFVLSGSFCGWGDMIIPYLDQVFFFVAPIDVRIQRLKERESKRWGAAIEPGKPQHEKFSNFLKWSEAYDIGGVSRTRKLHEDWLSKLSIEHTTISTDRPQAEVADMVLKKIASIKK